MAETQVQKVRKITIMVNSDSSRYDMTSNAKTWGELKSELSSELGKELGDLNKKKFVERESKSTFENDDIVLPSENFFLFAYAKESKGGISVKETDIKDMNYNELRSLGSSLNSEEDANLDLHGKTEEIREKILSYVKKKHPKKTSVSDPVLRKGFHPPVPSKKSVADISDLTSMFEQVIAVEREQAVEEFKALQEQQQSNDEEFASVVNDIADSILQEVHGLEKSTKNLKKIVEKYSDSEADMETLMKEARALKPR